MPILKEDLRYLQEKYADLLKNDADLPDHTVSSTEKDDRLSRGIYSVIQNHEQVGANLRVRPVGIFGL